MVREKALAWLGWLPKPCHTRTALGFTLAELLIALAILGVIATFTIPKIITAQTDAKNKAIVKEAASSMAGAFSIIKTNGLVTTSTKASDLSQYMNYVSSDSSGSRSIDQYQAGGTSVSCDAAHPCIFLQSGAAIRLGMGTFQTASTTQVIAFWVDPDGVVTDGTTNGPGKSVFVLINYNGRLSTFATVDAGSDYAGNPISPNPALEPPWFNWQ